MKTNYIKCSYCDGYGFVNSGYNCPVCGGPGKVKQIDLEISKNLSKSGEALGGVLALAITPFILPFIAPAGPLFVAWLICYFVFQKMLGFTFDIYAVTFISAFYSHILFLGNSTSFHKKLVLVSIVALTVILALIVACWHYFQIITVAQLSYAFIAGYFLINITTFYEMYIESIKILIVALIFWSAIYLIFFQN